MQPLIRWGIVILLALVPLYYAQAITIEYAPSDTVLIIPEREITAEDYIEEVFPKYLWEEAKAIMQCESEGDFVAHGDTHLMHYDAKYGEMVGDSIGTFQIRTGGRDWNRARANGMSAEEFREMMRDPLENTKYAYEIYKRNGWGAWSCKYVLK